MGMVPIGSNMRICNAPQPQGIQAEPVKIVSEMLFHQCAFQKLTRNFIRFKRQQMGRGAAERVWPQVRLP